MSHADYRKADIIGYVAGVDSTVAANTTTYLGQTRNGAENQVLFRAPYSGVLERLFAYSSGAPGAGETYTYTIRINGAPTIVTCQTAGAVLTTSEDVARAVNVVAGDEISVSLVTSLNAANAWHMTSFGLRK